MSDRKQMLSILLYGRNDAYGALAQRRSALSINTLAETLLQENDEIIFVDYNSDDEKLTFIEAIADTLTEKARECLRVVRVRPAQHLLLSRPGAPPVVESIARNIGLRHSNPANRWVLSTNPDIVLIPPMAGLGELLRGLKDDYYAAPRFELPRFLWQRLNRARPEEVVNAITHFAPQLHLDEAVHHYLPSIGFDAPGDFQLVLRSELMEVGGFNEAMQHAWHVDANLMARLALRHGKASSLGGQLKIYHCEHTADTAVKHSGDRKEDSFDLFVRDVSDAVANRGQAWGGEGFEFETIRLTSEGAPAIAEVLASVIGSNKRGSYTAVYGPESYGLVSRIDQHTLPFLIDRLFTFPRDTRFGWLGCEAELRVLVQTVLAQLGFTHTLLGGEQASRLAEADIILIDNPPRDAPPEAARLVWAEWGQVVAEEQRRIGQGLTRRRILAINAINSDFEGLLRQAFDVVLAPFTTRLRPALVSAPLVETVSWLDDLQIGYAGARTHNGAAIEIRRGQEGHVFFGPYKILLPGAYRVIVTANAQDAEPGNLVLEAVWGEDFLVQKDVQLDQPDAVSWVVDFVVPAQAIEPDGRSIQLRLWSDGTADGVVKSVVLSVVP